jgi:hypothetical protein
MPLMSPESSCQRCFQRHFCEAQKSIGPIKAGDFLGGNFGVPSNAALDYATDCYFCCCSGGIDSAAAARRHAQKDAASGLVPFGTYDHKPPAVEPTRRIRGRFVVNGPNEYGLTDGDIVVLFDGQPVRLTNIRHRPHRLVNAE